ncbi:MAG: Ca2+-dependent phosphoinositide-specific phospholipase C, partial [Halioglobus sp.]|nr:Ca2+-dependent phosphoinositide-specific phospholipase C [Halioglobus sp.]
MSNNRCRGGTGAAIARPGLTAALLATLLWACSGPGDYPRDAELRINQLQSLGTHNSFHPHPVGEPIESIIRKRYKYFVGQAEYRHAPLTRQLQELGVRNIELDIFADPGGGNFNRIPILAMVGESPRRNIPELDEPGFKVLHLPQIDPDSTCWTLKRCL